MTVSKGYNMKWNLNSLQSVRHKAGVYYLYKGDFCVYIGQSKNVYIRILEHIAEQKKDFDYFKAIEINDDRFRLAIETSLIFGHPKVPTFYNKDVLDDLKDMPLDQRVGMALNEDYNLLINTISPTSEYYEKILQCRFVTFFHLQIMNAENNNIILEQDYRGMKFHRFIKNQLPKKEKVEVQIVYDDEEIKNESK